MARKIFISYRRDPDLKDAQLLQGVLVRHFGKSNVFFGTADLESDKDRLSEQQRQVDASDVIVTLIGKGWTDATDEAGTRRLDNPLDPVRLAITRALSCKSLC